MNDFESLQQSDRRLLLLHLLSAAPTYTGNAYLLHQALSTHGHHPSIDSVKSDLAWLAEQGLVHLVVDPQITVATLTERGLDVAQGRAVVPGVKRPRPTA